MYKKETPKEPIVCLKLWGWGAKRWEVPTPNGSFVIEKEEPIKVPNLIPFRN